VTVQYLESLDSVRTGPGSGVPDDVASIAELQTFLEVLMALALGRQIVVPQSYALDSGAFLRVAHRVLAARPAVSEDRPFRPHLFGDGIDDFDDAFVAMLRRVHDPDRPFHSSLYPALQRMTAADVERVLADLDRRLVRVTGEVYVEPMKAVLQEFRRTDRYVVPAPGTGLRLDTALAELVDPHSTLSASAAGILGSQRAMYDRLTAAVRRLDPSRPGPFGQRSRLRQDVPWPNDPDGRTAAQLAGADLPLVIEFVDTLYNRVIADSMGGPLALYSTGPAADDEQLDARQLAQELALGRPPLLMDEEHPDIAPLFQVVDTGTRAGGDVRVRRDLAELFEHGAEALVPLMGARSRPGDRFWRGLREVAEAVEARDRRAHDKALEKHLGYVGKLLVGQVDVSWRAEAGIVLAVQAGKQAAEASQPPGVPSWVLDTALWGIERASTRASHAVARRGARRRLASAIGSVVPSSSLRRRP
jgi:hypothetical protein